MIHKGQRAKSNIKSHLIDGQHQPSDSNMHTQSKPALLGQTGLIHAWASEFLVGG